MIKPRALECISIPRHAVQQDERGREGDEGGMDVRAALVALPQASYPVEPGPRAREASPHAGRLPVAQASPTGAAAAAGELAREIAPRRAGAADKENARQDLAIRNPGPPASRVRRGGGSRGWITAPSSSGTIAAMLPDLRNQG
jgi:hypothetical protein